MTKTFRLSPQSTDSFFPPVQERTVIFTSFNNNKVSWIKNIIYRKMIRQHAILLLKRNYNFFIVSYGNTYGRLAMLELLNLRKKFQFHITAEKIIGEYPPDWTRGFDELVVISSCDKLLGPIDISAFLNIVSMSYAISSEIGLNFHCGKIPRPLLSYLKTLN